MRVDTELLYKGKTIFYSENDLKGMYISLYIYFRHCCVVLLYVVLKTIEIRMVVGLKIIYAISGYHH